MESSISYKASKYNYIIDLENGSAIYNARTGIIASIDDKIKPYLIASKDFCHFDSNILKPLIDCGFVHNGDEIDKINKRYGNRINNQNYLHFAIAPTLNCNFKCPYCYEDNIDRNRSLSNDDFSKMISFIYESIKGIDAFSITWFGGEPLLELEKILYVTKYFSKIAIQSNKLFQTPSIVTNGTIPLNDDIDDIIESGIQGFQITIDSKYYKSPIKRGLLNFDNTPSVILENIILLKKKIGKISVRINIGKHNIDELHDIIEICKSYNIFELCHIAQITDHHKSNVCSNNSFQLDLGTYSTYEKDFYESTLSYNEYFKLLKPKECFCGATSNEMLVIDPDGNISRCWHSVGKSHESIGDIFQGIYNNAIYKRWENYNPLLNNDCRECKALPLCMGGCAHPKIFIDNSLQTCDSIKNHIDIILKRCWEVINKMANSSSDE